MQRNHYFDFLRGIAIMMVVAIHTFNAAETDLLHNMIDINILVRQLLNCAVPIFLAISGYFLCVKNLDTWNERQIFWRKQIPKIYIPTMIVSLPYLVLALLHGKNLFEAVAMMLICGYSIYYFIALILQYYVLLPIFYKIKMGGGVLCAIISLVSILVISYITKIIGYELPLIVYAGPFPVWCVFFAMGCYLRKSKWNYSLFLPFIMTLVGIVMSYGETYYWNINYGGGFGIKISSFVYSMAVITLIFSQKIECVYKRNVMTKGVEYVGYISFPIYLYHFIIIDCFRMFHTVNNMPWCICWGTCMVMTIVLIKILKYVVPQKYCCYFGI